MGDATVNEGKLKIREGEFRSYDVSSREVINGTTKLLKAAGYTFLPNDPVGLVRPVIRATREYYTGRRNDIVAVSRPNLKRATDGFIYLMAAQSVLGDKAEYVLLLPPTNEWLLLEYLDADGGRAAKELNARHLMLWMYNPAEDAILSFVGGSCDPVFRGSMLVPGFCSMRMIEQKMAAEAKRKASGL